LEKLLAQTKIGEMCCADAYSNDAVRLILGDTWHPGGLELTGRLASKLGIGPEDRLVDVACGIGTTARFLATNFGCAVVGMDHSFQNVGQGIRRLAANEVEFAVGESNYVPLADGSADAIIMECVLSGFDDKTGVIAEATRVLKPTGKLGVSDVVVNGEIPEALRSPFLQTFCVSGALSTNGYRELFRNSGLENIIHEDADEEAIEFVESLKKKVFVAQLLVGVGKQLPVVVSSDQLKEASRLLSMARRSIQEHALGYGLFVARKR